jgi:hypothetical protein
VVSVTVAGWLAVRGGITGFVLTTAFLFGPLLFLLRRWRPPAGSAAITLGVQCVLMQAVTGFDDAGPPGSGGCWRSCGRRWPGPSGP